MAEFTKTPEGILDYVIDWSAWLDSDTISTSVWSVDSGLTNVSDSNTTTAATIWLSGGEDGTSYNVRNTITTAGGRTEIRSFKINCASA
jgi:hypothetical protein